MVTGRRGVQGDVFFSVPEVRENHVPGAHVNSVLGILLQPITVDVYTA